MKSTPKLIKRFLLILMLSLFLLLGFNLILLATVGQKFASNGSPWTSAEEVAASLTPSGSGFSLSEAGADTLLKSAAWAVLIDDASGDVVWNSDNLPGEIPRHYSAAAISLLTRGYIQDYPTSTCGYGEDLLVLGFPKKSYWKHMYNTFSYDMIAHSPQIFLTFLLCNLAVIFFIYWGANIQLLKSLKPILTGIQALPESENDIHLKETGLLSEVSASINRACELIRSQNYQLQKKENARANWIAGVSHDIRTPLSMVMGYAETLAEDPSLPEDARKKADVICRQSLRMKDLISDLNLSSRLEYNMQPLNLKKIPLIPMVRKAVADFINLDIDNRYPVEWNADDSLAGCCIMADKDLIYRAIANLLLNSRNHNPGGCQICVRVEYADGGTSDAGYAISIEDNGTGITSNELDRLYHASYSSLSCGQSHGLGLLIVRQITDAHHGKVELGHSACDGFRARIILPSAPS